MNVLKTQMAPMSADVPPLATRTLNSNCRLRRPVSICVHLLPSVLICVDELAFGGWRSQSRTALQAVDNLGNLCVRLRRIAPLRELAALRRLMHGMVGRVGLNAPGIWMCSCGGLRPTHTQCVYHALYRIRNPEEGFCPCA